MVDASCFKFVQLNCTGLVLGTILHIVILNAAIGIVLPCNSGTVPRRQSNALCFYNGAETVHHKKEFPLTFMYFSSQLDSTNK